MENYFMKLMPKHSFFVLLISLLTFQALIIAMRLMVHAGAYVAGYINHIIFHHLPKRERVAKKETDQKSRYTHHTYRIQTWLAPGGKFLQKTWHEF
jgi:hypothetical protein